MVAAKQESPAIEMTLLAGEAMEECGHERRLAATVLLRWLEADSDLLARLLPYILEETCDRAVAGVDGDTRRTLRRAALRAAPDHPANRRKAIASPPPAPNPDRVAPFLMRIQEERNNDPDFYRWPLPGGGFLGNATPAEVLLAARFYGQSEATGRINRRFYELIHEAMQGGSCVSKVLPHDALLRLRRRVEEEEAGR